jgi:uncharacterized membrane protein (Fun14 family)
VEAARVDLAGYLDPSHLALLGGGTVAGVAVGYAAKRAIRWALLATGLILIGLFLLGQQGFITVHWQAVGEGLETSSRGASSWLMAMVQQLSPTLVGFSAGFLVGLKLS